MNNYRIHQTDRSVFLLNKAKTDCWMKILIANFTSAVQWRKTIKCRFGSVHQDMDGWRKCGQVILPNKWGEMNGFDQSRYCSQCHSRQSQPKSRFDKHSMSTVRLINEFEILTSVRYVIYIRALHYSPRHDGESRRKATITKYQNATI